METPDQDVFWPRFKVQVTLAPLPSCLAPLYLPYQKGGSQVQLPSRGLAATDNCAATLSPPYGRYASPLIIAIKYDMGRRAAKKEIQYCAVLLCSKLSCLFLSDVFDPRSFSLLYSPLCHSAPYVLPWPLLSALLGSFVCFVTLSEYLSEFLPCISKRLATQTLLSAGR